MARQGRRSHLEILQTSESPAARRYAAKLLRWLGYEADPAERDRLAAAIRSCEDSAFYGAALELYLAQFFKRRRWTVERHPEVVGSTHRPDYLVHSPYGDFYVEAAAILDPTVHRAEDTRRLELLEALRTVEGPFSVIMTPLTSIPAGFAPSQVRRFLEARLREAAETSGQGRWEFNFSSQPPRPAMEIRFDVLPSAIHGQVLGATMLTGPEAIPVTTADAVQAKIREKLALYPRGVDFVRPFVIALQVETQFPPSHHQIDEALRGTLSVHVPVARDAPLVYRRAGDGIFSGRDQDGRPIRTRLSAVMIYRHWLLNTDNHRLAVYHNVYGMTRYPLELAVFEGVSQQAVVPRPAGGSLLAWTPRAPNWL